MYTRRRGGGMCLRTGRGGEDVGISNRRGARCMSPLARTRGVREVSATTCDSDGVADADGRKNAGKAAEVKRDFHRTPNYKRNAGFLLWR